MTSSPPSRRPLARLRSLPWARLATELTTVRTAPGSLRVALRVIASITVPLLALWIGGRLDWALYAPFGAFASVYGGGSPSPRRWRLQGALALLLTAAVACGVIIALSDRRAWIAVLVTAWWGVVAARLFDRYRWVPRGPMFPVFAVATCASVPIAPDVVALAIGVAAGTAALADGLGAVENRYLRPSEAGDTRGDTTAPLAYPLPDRRRQLLHAVRCGVAVTLAGATATASGVGHPYWAMVASVVPLSAPTLLTQVVRGAHRLVGTLVGLALSAVLLHVTLPVPAVLLVVIALQGATELLVVRHYGTALVAITPLALLLGQLASPQPAGPLLVDRLLETVIGVGIGVLTAVVTRRQRPRIDPT